MDLLAVMRSFRRVVELQSFNKAAEELGQSNASISKQIRQLEQRLGTVLILRTTRRMSLSENGRGYFAECCRLLDELDHLERTTSGEAGEVNGRLRLNAPLSFGLTVLAPMLARFMTLHPQLKVDMTLDDHVLDVVSEGFDVSIRVRAALTDSSLIARRLGDIEQIICAAPGYLASHGTPTAVSDLKNHDCLTYRLADQPGSWVLEGPNGAASVDLPARFVADNSLMLSEMIQSGIGIGVLPSFIADPLLASGRLLRVLPGHQLAQRGIYVVYPTNRLLLPKVKVFTEFLAAEFRQAGF
ncbi:MULTISPECIES: LysR family transcriptional regulator [unclassified Ensifer]|uniref:LysR family transcriptional regulator n=1 Tax=unclassified Ensifer TaxID=2633371 RepID=UPI0008131DF5|nr:MULTISPECIES: LysR family transcriptional regulator [unclassified Ensifer]OCP00617.1 LysR family transcriptional regulator [Ensifer sp. LC14]OCP07830.1 LysR family transcriptional regulator [Ensifer sp. LC11]OCP08597.1 LysR family transcriptional regulator [Ensifer sp. LC13]OCP32111.1 LysR family transcriptional regulator [Ensifer sp. LC499]